MKEGDPQTHNTTCAARVMKSKIIGWSGSKILCYKESLSQGKDFVFLCGKHHMAQTRSIEIVYKEADNILTIFLVRMRK